MMRTFELMREVDVSGVSGVGKVAEGVTFSNGKTVVTWLGKISSVTVYDSFEQVEAIHGHQGSTKIKFNAIQPSI